MLLAAVSVLIVKEAIERWLEPVAVNGQMLLVTAVLGLLVNLLVAWLLLRGQRDSINVRAALAHVLSDALGSVGAILAGVAVTWFGLVTGRSAAVDGHRGAGRVERLPRVA